MSLTDEEGKDRDYRWLLWCWEDYHNYGIGKKLSQEGKRVAVVSNDKGAINVDGEMTKRLGFEAEEITGGCVCFYLDHLGYIIDTITERLSQTCCSLSQ